ncbi:LysR family transcriptional regulator [Enterococcus hermanniensis]|uniref:HTH lysR-type domain-containing protein n=1 Tax=Enterococcus hermanniensis TaxID=249189 RepID=A0A1L8TPF6_9ENTE|nr:LysR family transcriptional regulator [Enterococcus hermanniensis]OJG46215.1 hypothetical protein RV04_GL001381 [Enterococcus hermanniensis]
METRLLRYFWTVAQEGNISKAARLLNITQPTLSRQIKELEEMLGTSVFNREKNKLSLTTDGLFLKERAEEILSLDEKLEQAFFDRRNEQLSGHFSIGCVEADNSDTVAMMIEELISDYPQVKFNLVTGTSDDIVDRLEKGILDLAVLLEPVSLNEVEQLRLPREEKWGVIVSKELFIAQNNQINPEDIKGMPLLCSNRQEVKELLCEWSGMSLSELNIIGNYNLLFNILPLVENRVGAAFAIEGALYNRQLENLIFLPLNPEVKTQCVLVWKKRVQTPLVQEIIKRFKYAFQA